MISAIGCYMLLVVYSYFIVITVILSLYFNLDLFLVLITGTL